MDKAQAAVIEIPITGFRIVAEWVVTAFHAVSWVTIITTPALAGGIAWTLLTLCITTINTLVQFWEEGKWRFVNNWLFYVPIGGFGLVAIILMASFTAPAISAFVQNKVFVGAVLGAITIRQGIHASMIFGIYRENKQKEAN